MHLKSMSIKDKWLGSDKYVCDMEIAQAFHMARVLGMPLLIEGEPGTGKTELAIQFAKDQDVDLFVFPVGSKSNTEQFVASFDHVKYLRDSQIEVLNLQREEKGMDLLSLGGRNTSNLNDYQNYGPAALAFAKPNSVLLIDEIDKAPREFPNDLLYALSHRKLTMPESGEVLSVTEDQMPAIVITSNREQELPNAFKGRCIYHYISFPEPELMTEIVQKHYPEISSNLADRCINLFYEMRKLGLERSPSTRELLNWLKYLQIFPKDQQLDEMKKMEGLGVLVKSEKDLKKVSSWASKIAHV